MVFNLLKAKLELLWCIERTVWGLQAAWRVLFIIFRHMTTQYHSSNEKRETDVRDVNNSDSGPWNIWCRNLIYFKSSSVLSLSSTKQWNSKLRSELKVTVSRERRDLFVFSDQLFLVTRGTVTSSWDVSGGHWCHHSNTRPWLVRTGHVTWILACNWSILVITQSCHHPISSLATDMLQSPATTGWSGDLTQSDTFSMM